MIHEVEFELPVRAVDVEPFLSDLSRYPEWMGLVHHVGPQDDRGGRIVELRGKIGPFARSKRLRMVRVDDPTGIRFERQELDGGDHGQWVLHVAIAELAEAGTTVASPAAITTRLSIRLLYEGRLWSSVVERVLADEIEQSKDRLRDLLGVAS